MNPGDVIDNFQLVRELGSGSFGEVWLADQLNLKRQVALKFLKEDMTSPEEIRRFQREAETLAQIDHPNVCRIHQICEFKSPPYIVSQFIDGETLSTWMEANAPVEPSRMIEILAPLSDGLGQAHGKGITHRDVKPSNILMKNGKTPVLVDFGICLREDESRLTKSHDRMGTKKYMAPEQWDGRIGEIGPASDVWALGIIMFKLLTATHPFTPQKPLFEARVVGIDPGSPSDLEAGIPHLVDRICLKALVKEPEFRYPNAAALRDALLAPKEAKVEVPFGKTLPRAERETVVTMLPEAPQSAVSGTQSDQDLPSTQTTIGASVDDSSPLSKDITEDPGPIHITQNIRGSDLVIGSARNVIQNRGEDPRPAPRKEIDADLPHEAFVVINHAPEDRGHAVRLSRAIRSSGVATWFIPRDVPDHSTKENALAAAIENCDALLTLVSGHYLKDVPAQQGVRSAHTFGVQQITVQVDPETSADLVPGAIGVSGADETEWKTKVIQTLAKLLSRA